MLIGAAWRDVRDRFLDAGLTSPELDARLLAQYAFGLDDIGLIVQEREAVDPQNYNRFLTFVDRRLSGEPVARILGAKEFYGLLFGLNADTLVPRPETELLVDRALFHLDVNAPTRALDLGTGSGCIAISMLANRPLLEVIAVDVSKGALAQTKSNALDHGVGSRLHPALGSWFSPLAAERQFDAIVSNPPYINTNVIDALAKDVRLFDPMIALDGGSDGIRDYREISCKATDYLKPGGYVLVEIGFDQGEVVGQLFEQYGFHNVAVHKDLAGLDRVVVAQTV